jgi:hypothetical protein
MLLQPELFSPKYVYPADGEILQDVILFLLGRMSASPRSVMPASLICVAADSQLQANYEEAVHHAFLVPRPGGEEVHVPIAHAQALEILKGESVRIGSVIVTMDGRWWDAVCLQMGELHSVVYRPMGRLRLDHEASQVRLRVSFSVNRLGWPGRIPFPDSFEIFGREWHLSQWEQDSERTCLHLAISRVLPMSELVPGSDARLRRWQPASVDMAWSDLEDALTRSLVQGRGEPIERLRESDLIPLGRAIFELAVSLMSRPLPTCEVIETQLRGIDCLEAQVSSKYGRVPWRILPAKAQTSFFKIRSDAELLGLLNQVFDSLPERLSTVTSPAPRPDRAVTADTLQSSLLIHLGPVGIGSHFIMEKAAITLIVFGAMFLVVGLIPGLLSAPLEGLRNFRDGPSALREPIYDLRTDMRLYGDFRLVVGGGVAIIVGLLALS